MPFPKDWDSLVQEGYKWENDAECRGCGEEIMWFTTPNGRKIPMNKMTRGTDPAIAHFSTCPEADSFRKSK